MKKKVILSLLLLSISGVLFATLWPERQQAGNFVAVQDSVADEARTFTRELLELARKNSQKEFASRCADISNRDLPRQFATMRKSRVADSPAWPVEKIDQEKGVYMVGIETGNAGTYRCALSRNPAKNEWKFLGLYDE